MKVNGLNIEEHGSGYSVTIRLFVGAEEAAGPLFEGMLDLVSFDDPDDDVGLTVSPEVEAEPEPEPEPEEAPKRGKRGKRGKAGPSTQPVSDATAPADTAKPGKRGGKKPTPSSTAQTNGPRAAKKASPAKGASPSEEITDEDLIKAVSECARKIGAIAAEEIIEGFDVEKLNEVSQERRQELLDAFAAAENDA